MARVKGQIAKRRSFKLTEKKAIIERVKLLQSAGNSMRSIAADLKIPHTTLTSMVKREDKIGHFLMEHPASQVTTLASNHDPVVAQMESKLFNWMEEQVGQGMVLSEKVIRTKAKWLYDSICDQIGHEPKFLASPGWFSRFKKRNKIKCVKKVGEAALVDNSKVSDFVKQFHKIVQKGKYSPEQIYNVDETGLFWRQKKRKTYTTSKQIPVAAKGEKADKSRVTVLLGGNASGTHKLKPVLIHKFENPRPLAHIDKSTLPVHYRWNNSCWMFSDMFKDWFYNCFIPEVKAHLKSKKLRFKALLVIDNAPVHPTDLKYRGVQIVFMPPNTSCLLQPMDQTVIQTFKSYYTRNAMFEAFTTNERNKESSPAEYWNQFKIDSCIRHTAKAWEQVSTNTLHSSWKQILPSMWKDDANTSKQQEEEKVKEVESTVVPEEFDLTGDPAEEIMNRTELTKNEISDLRGLVCSGDTVEDQAGSESMECDSLPTSVETLSESDEESSSDEELDYEKLVQMPTDKKIELVKLLLDSMK